MPPRNRILGTWPNTTEYKSHICEARSSLYICASFQTVPLAIINRSSSQDGTIFGALSSA